MVGLHQISILAACSVPILLFAITYGPDLIDNLLLPSLPPPEASNGQPRQWGPHKDTDTAKPFKIQVEDEVLVDLQDRLQKWRAPGSPMKHDDPWSYGIDSTFMTKLVQHWKDKYDWKKYEAELNSLGGLSEMVVDGLKMRMYNIKRGDGKKAILLLHGWPGSIWEFHGFIKMMTKQEKLEEYSIVCPSLPGYGFSSAPDIEGYDILAMGGTMQRLMKKLGYEKYIIQGGDWGSFVAQSAAYLNPTSLIGLHLNFFPVTPTPGHFLLEEFKIRLFDDAESQARASKSKDLGDVLMNTGYLHQQATKPETLGFALSDSPVGLCAWIAEKFQSWSDPSLDIEEKYNLDEIITNCMIYWVTNSITSSMRLYKEQFRSEEANAIGGLTVRNLPVALSLFKFELFPSADTPIKRKFLNIVSFKKHEIGGHFAALEQPDLLLDDLVQFVERVSKN